MVTSHAVALMVLVFQLPGYLTARMAWLTSRGSFTAFLFQELNALIIFLN